MRAHLRLLVYTLFLLSGCTALIYELVWVRELIFVLGGITYAITTVLVAFVSGLALGSFLAGLVSGFKGIRYRRTILKWWYVRFMKFSVLFPFGKLGKPTIYKYL